MFALLWIPATIAGSLFQVARNALQRGVMTAAGPWGATLVRFLFGLPFAVVFVGVAISLTRDVSLHFTPAFWVAACSGATTQVFATASLLLAMDRAGFAVGTTLQQSSLPLAALLGLIVYDDRLSPLAWIGVTVTTAGLVTLGWPARGATGTRPLSGAMFGLISGLCFGFSLNAFRHAGLILEPRHPIVSALASVAIVQAIQATGMTLILLACDRRAIGVRFGRC